MNSADYSLTAGARDLAREGEKTSPRILFLPSPEVDQASSAEAIAHGLQNESWPIGLPSDLDDRSDTAPSGFLRFTGPVGAWWRTARSMARLIPKYQIIQISFISPEHISSRNLAALVLARFFGKKVVAQFGTASIERLINEHRRWLLPVLKLADTIVVESRYLQRAFARVGLESSILTRPRNLDGLEHAVRTRLQPRIIVESDLEPDLNVGCAIRAYRLVKQKYPRAELVVIGDGHERSNLERLVDRDGFYGIEFLGRLDRAARTAQYREADLLLHTPTLDVSPDALVWAFASGLPVVATDADGLLPMIRDGVSAMIVASGDHVAAADAVIELVENNELSEKLSRRGAVETRKYLWSRVRQDWVNLYCGAGK